MRCIRFQNVKLMHENKVRCSGIKQMTVLVRLGLSSFSVVHKDLLINSFVLPLRVPSFNEAFYFLLLKNVLNIAICTVSYPLCCDTHCQLSLPLQAGEIGEMKDGVPEGAQLQGPVHRNPTYRPRYRRYVAFSTNGPLKDLCAHPLMVE